MWHTCTVELYSAVKKSKVMLLAEKQTLVEIITVRKIGQFQKDKGCGLSHVCNQDLEKGLEEEGRWWVLDGASTVNVCKLHSET